MRKDLKIGMAIGAVLLVVLVVYFAMPKPEGIDVATAGPETGEALTGTDPESTPSSDEPAGAEPRLQDDASAPVAADAGQPRPDVFDASADASVADDDDEESPAEGDGGGTNWAKLLESGEADVVVRTETPTVGSRGTDDEATPADAGTANDNSSEALPRLSASRREADAPARAVTPGSILGGDATNTASDGDDETDPVTSVPPTNTTSSTVGAPSPTVQPAGARTHIVQAGENYSTIAKAVYGDSRHYLAIEKANPDIDATRMRPGTVIKLPDPATVKGAKSGASGAQADDTRVVDLAKEYRVKPNDSLHKIAVERYGSSAMVDKIYELNKDAIGADPAKLKLGMILKMPAEEKRDQSVAR
jgi:nucleoid-associated protein YgaU